MGRKIQHEETLQINIAKELRLNMPEHIPWTAVESSGRGSRDGARQKKKGVNKSWADLQFIIPPLGTYLGIELKNDKDEIRGIKKSYQDKDQKEFEARIKSVGGLYHVARSMDEVWAILLLYGVEKGRFINDNSLQKQTFKAKKDKRPDGSFDTPAKPNRNEPNKEAQRG